jgi:hypothetical protein
VTSEIPIVFVSAGDPVTLNLVSSLNRPNENVTGISMITVALAPKRLELLNEVVPGPVGSLFLPILKARISGKSGTTSLRQPPNCDGRLACSPLGA